MCKGVIGPESDGLATGRAGRLQGRNRLLQAAQGLEGKAQAAEVPTVPRP